MFRKLVRFLLRKKLKERNCNTAWELIAYDFVVDYLQKDDSERGSFKVEPKCRPILRTRK